MKDDLQEELQFPRLDKMENTDQTVKSVGRRRKTLTGTTIVLAQTADRVEHVVVRGGGKMIQPVYKKTQKNHQ